MLKKIKRGAKKIMKDAVELIKVVMEHSVGKVLYDDIKKIITKTVSSDKNIKKAAIFVCGSMLSAVATTFVK